LFQSLIIAHYTVTTGFNIGYTLNDDRLYRFVAL